MSRTRTTSRALSRRLAGAFVALVVVAAACGDDDDDDSAAPETTAASVETDATTAATEAPSTEPEGTEETTPATEAPETTTADTADERGRRRRAAVIGEAASGDPVQGGDLVVATLFDSFGFDPVKVVGGIADGTVATAVFDTLMTYDDNDEIVPHLAESLETEDQQSWTLTLRPDVTFTDGTPLDAEAVKFNIERHQDVSLLSRSILNALNIESMTVVDPLTLDIQLKFPWTAFPETLVGSLGIIGSPTALADPDSFNSNPVGAGAFKLVEWVPGDHITLEQNPDYWNASEGEPHVDTVTFRIVLDTQTRTESVKNDEIHLAQSTNGAEVLYADEDDMVGYPVYGPGITVQMNTTKPPFDDPRVRMAILQAMDRRGAAVGGLPGRRRVAAEQRPHRQRLRVLRRRRAVPRVRRRSGAGPRRGVRGRGGCECTPRC